MGSLVVTGATLQCSMGTSPATFYASATTPTGGGGAGVVTDVSPSNVPTFGMCQSMANPQVASATAAAQGVLTPQPCQPVLAPWSPGSARVTVNQVPALDDASQCMCAWGGTVTAADAGQTSVTVE